MSAIRRHAARQMDVVEWAMLNRARLDKLKVLRRSEEKGVITYLNDGRAFIAEYNENRQKRKSLTAEEKKAKAVEEAQSDSGRAIQQQFESLDLLKKMKWKRVTWDQGADYTAFARRMMDNDAMFSAVPAMSFMSIHVVKDPSRSAVADPGDRDMNAFKVGDLTSWFVQEPEVVQQPKYSLPEQSSAGPFSVDWESGTANISDSATAFEIKSFLLTIAERLQAVQVRMGDEQEKVAADLDVIKFRAGFADVAYNKHNTSFWDDPLRKEASYISPKDVRDFVDGSLKEATLLKWYFGGLAVRVGPRGTGYLIDEAKREVTIPCNFSEFNYLSMHRRWIAIERVANAFRTTWWLWFCVMLLVFGDLEVI